MKTAKTTIAVMTAVAVLSTVIALGPGTALAGTTRPASRAAGPPGITGLVIYAARTQVLSANGTTSWIAVCPAGFLPVGGGAIIQDPRLENVTQAGFHTNAATRKFDGYQASVHVSGLQAGSAVGFIVQVACMPAATPVVYRIRTQVFPARGRAVRGKACHAGICPVGGATTPRARIENVTQAGFYAGAATGKFDGYQASVSLSTRPGGGKVLFTVQVVCMAVQTPPVYGPRAQLFPALRSTARSVTCPAGTIPVAGGAMVANRLIGVRPVLVSG
jgi:hypothetical protein